MEEVCLSEFSAISLHTSSQLHVCLEKNEGEGPVVSDLADGVSAGRRR